MNNYTLIKKLNKIKEGTYLIEKLIDELVTEEKKKGYSSSEKKALASLKKCLKNKTHKGMMKVVAPIEMVSDLGYRFNGQTLYTCLNGHVILATTKKYDVLPHLGELTPAQEIELNMKNEDDNKFFNIRGFLETDLIDYSIYKISSGEIIYAAKTKKDDKPFIVRNEKGERVAGYNPEYLKWALGVLEWCDDDLEIYIQNGDAPRTSPAYVINDRGYALILPVNIRKDED